MHKFTFEFKTISLGSIFGIISKQGKKIEQSIAFAMQQVEKSLEGDLQIVSDCRLDYRGELARELDLESKEEDNFSDAQLILMSYSKWGASCVKHLLGDFAFAILDPERQVLFCARDHMGCRPFYYYEDHQNFIFSSNPQGFKRVPEFEYLPRDEAILHLFNSKALPINLSFYSGMKRLAPAHSLVYGAEPSLIIQRYWDLEVDPEYSSLSYEKAQELYNKLLKEAVAQRIRKHSTFGVELSGGLDSSAVMALVDEVKQEYGKVHAFTNALSVEQQQHFFPFVDETSYAKKVVEHLGIDTFNVVEGIKERTSLEAIYAAMEISHSPLFQLFPAFSDHLLDKVKDENLSLLLSGFGGDECVTYHARGILHEYAEQGEWKKIRRALAGKQGLRKLEVHTKLFLEHRMFRGHSSQIKGLLKKGQKRYRISDLAIGGAHKKSFLKLEKGWKDARKQPEYLIREQQRRRLFHESLSDRLENSYFQAQKRGIEYAYPLLDVKLLRLVYSLPVEFQNRKGVGRYLMREAMKDSLPDEIRLRNNKFGAAVPNIFFRFHLDKDVYLTLIDEAEKNNKFHYLDYDKLRWQLEKLMDQKNFKKLSFGPRIFFSSISLLLLQKWEREGKMKTGIKC